MVLVAQCWLSDYQCQRHCPSPATSPISQVVHHDRHAVPWYGNPWILWRQKCTKSLCCSCRDSRHPIWGCGDTFRWPYACLVEVANEELHHSLVSLQRHGCVEVIEPLPFADKRRDLLDIAPFSWPRGAVFKGFHVVPLGCYDIGWTHFRWCGTSAVSVSTVSEVDQQNCSILPDPSSIPSICVSTSVLIWSTGAHVSRPNLFLHLCGSNRQRLYTILVTVQYIRLHPPISWPHFQDLFILFLIYILIVYTLYSKYIQRA